MQYCVARWVFFASDHRKCSYLFERTNSRCLLVKTWMYVTSAACQVEDSQDHRGTLNIIFEIWIMTARPPCKIENVVTINCEFSLPRLTGTCGLYIVHCHSQTTFISYKFLVADNRSSTATLSYKSRFNSSVVKFAPTYWLATLQRIPYVHSVLKATALL